MQNTFDGVTPRQAEFLDRSTDDVLSRIEGSETITPELRNQIRAVLYETYYRGTQGPEAREGLVDESDVQNIRDLFRNALARLGITDRQKLQIELESTKYSDSDARDILATQSLSTDNIALAITGGHGIKFRARKSPTHKRLFQELSSYEKGDVLFGKPDEEAIKEEILFYVKAILRTMGITDRNALMDTPMTCNELIIALREGMGGTTDRHYICLKNRNKQAFFNQYFAKNMREQGFSKTEIEIEKKRELAEFVFGD